MAERIRCPFFLLCGHPCNRRLSGHGRARAERGAWGGRGARRGAAGRRPVEAARQGRNRWSRQLGPAGTEANRCHLPWMPSPAVQRQEPLGGVVVRLALRSLRRRIARMHAMVASAATGRSRMRAPRAKRVRLFPSQPLARGPWHVLSYTGWCLAAEQQPRAPPCSLRGISM